MIQTPRQRHEDAIRTWRGLPLVRNIDDGMPVARPRGTALDTRLLEAISEVTGVDTATIKSGSITRSAARARWIYMLYRREKLSLTHNDTARKLNRDYTTIKSGIKRGRDLRITDPEFAWQYETVVAAL